jgi:hypothetical protein
LEIYWGDGISLMVTRSNNDGEGLPLDNDIKLNIYMAEHTYSSVLEGNNMPPIVNLPIEDEIFVYAG